MGLRDAFKKFNESAEKMRDQVSDMTNSCISDPSGNFMYSDEKKILSFKKEPRIPIWRDNNRIISIIIRF